MFNNESEAEAAWMSGEYNFSNNSLYHNIFWISVHKCLGFFVRSVTVLYQVPTPSFLPFLWALWLF